MRTRLLQSSKWTVLGIVLVMTGSGCTTGIIDRATPSSPASSPAGVPTQTLSSAPTEGQATAPSAVVAPAKQAPSPPGVLYQDDFTDPTSGWPNGITFGNYYVGYHEPTYYHVEVHASNDNAVVTVPKKSFGDFTAQTKVFAEPNNTAQTGDFRYGLVFRRAGNQYYAFAISPRTKTWYVLKSSPAGLIELKKGTHDSIQGLQAADTLGVDVKGSTFVFHINGQTIDQVSDADYASGEVGFYVETFDSPRAHIHYDTITIREVGATPLLNGVLYQDDFTDTASGWPNGVVFDNYYIGYHEPNHYHVEVHVPHDNAVVVVPKKSFDDFTVQTKVVVEPNNTAQTGDFRYGLVFRRSGNQYYAFAISPRTKTWYVLKRSPTGLAELKKGTHDSIQGLQADDMLRVDVKGSNFFFYINDQAIGQISDSDYTSGEVGFYVETFDSPRAHIHYGGITIGSASPVAATTSATPMPAPATSSATLACTIIGQTLRRFNDNADMVCVPAGQFLMGSANSDVYALADEKPQHTVNLDAFWIDKTEVTNAQYNQCVQAGACKSPTPMNGSMPGMSMTTQDNQPISDMLWDEAAAYCHWAGGTLPTEAQWEKAARGTDGRTYPWGNQPATCDYAVMNDGSGPACGKQDAPWPVGSKPQGASLYGALDMAGNVWEFTSDWYDPNYYANSPTSNPQGPSLGTEHTVRGGSLFMEPGHVRAAFRGTGVVHAVHGSQGFRCVLRTLP